MRFNRPSFIRFTALTAGRPISHTKQNATNGLSANATNVPMHESY